MNSIIEVKHEDKIFRIAWCFGAVNDMDHSFLLSSLNEREQEMAGKFPSRSRAKEFVAGRYCARQAFALYNGIAKQDVIIGIGAWGYPFIEGSDENISIAHTTDYVIAACSGGGFPIGVDLENCKASNDELIITQLSHAERKIVNTFSYHSEGLHILWAAKEAAAKALRTGFRISMPLFEVSAAIQKQGAWHIKFDTLGVLSVIAVRTKCGVLALALPSGSTVGKGFDTFCSLENIDSQLKHSI